MESHPPSDGWLRLLDEDLLRTGAIHDARGILTALWARVDLHAAPDVTREALLGRLADVLRELGRSEGAPWPEEGFWACLEGLAGRESGERAREAFERSGQATLEGVPASGLVAGWSLPGVRQWMATGDSALRGARVRAAARRCGLILSARPESGGEHVSLTIARASG